MDNPIIMAMIITLCISSLLQLVILIAILVRLLISDTSKRINDQPAAFEKASPRNPLTSLEEEKLREQRKKFDEEMEAFQQMLNYNADVAYGINKETDNVR